jgi:4'-phosphopantetheinyl transferase
MPSIAVRFWPVELSDRIDPADIALLDGVEETRARRFVRPEHAARFVTGRAALRRALGRELGIEPACVPLKEGDAGRPEIAGVPVPLQFNVSHSGKMAAIALCREVRLGVDIERLAPIEADLVERFFSPAEQAALAALPEDRWLRGFYRCWTRKEAFVKGLGQGLLLPLDGFDVAIGDRPALLRCAFARAEDWTLVTLPVGPDHEAVAAVEAKGASVSIEIRPGDEIGPGA